MIVVWRQRAEGSGVFSFGVFLPVATRRGRQSGRDLNKALPGLLGDLHDDPFGQHLRTPPGDRAARSPPELPDDPDADSL